MERTWREFDYHITFKDGTTESDCDYMELPVDEIEAQKEYESYIKHTTYNVDSVSMTELED